VSLSRTAMFMRAKEAMQRIVRKPAAQMAVARRRLTLEPCCFIATPAGKSGMNHQAG
jgi:hypothetical protein